MWNPLSLFKVKTKKKEILLWMREDYPTEQLIGQVFEYEGRMVKVIGISILTITVEDV